jgi:CRISPR-associated protein Cmr2
MNNSDFVSTIAQCLKPDAPPRDLVRDVLDAGNKPSRESIGTLQRSIRQQLGDADRIDLVYGGATKIKGYVFEAARLPEIRGASALLDFAGDQEVRRIWRERLGDPFGEECLIYAGGGNFLAFAPAGRGPELAQMVERNYTDLTQTALSVAVSASFRLIELRYGRLSFDEHGNLQFWIEEFQRAWQDEALRPQLDRYYGSSNDTRGERFYQRKTFGELVTLLATMYNRRRDERFSNGEERYLAMVPRLPWLKRCESSDQRPALLTTGDYGALSEASVRKLAVGRRLKSDRPEIVRELEQAINWQVPAKLAEKSWEARWREFLSNKGADTPYAKAWQELGERVVPAQDTHQIGKAGGGFIGLLYADGNNVGRKIATIATPQEYRAFSDLISVAATDAVFRALATHLRPQRDGDRWFHPFEILAIGGDDLLIIVPGKQALAIACDIAHHFESHVEAGSELRPPQGRYIASQCEHVTRFDGYRPTIGLSAGLVIAHEDAPIFFLRDLVESLLKSAKKAARSASAGPDGGMSGGAIDFMVLKSITMVSDTVESFRTAALNGSACNLTARPYSWRECAGLLETLRRIKQGKVPRSQLYRLRSVLEQARDQGPLASSLEYLYTRVRQQSGSAQALQEAIEHDWHAAAAQPPWMPRSPDDHAAANWETIWADLVEIYDMTEGG